MERNFGCVPQSKPLRQFVAQKALCGNQPSKAGLLLALVAGHANRYVDAAEILGDLDARNRHQTDARVLDLVFDQLSKLLPDEIGQTLRSVVACAASHGKGFRGREESRSWLRSG
jgi:hypothetical protein